MTNTNPETEIMQDILKGLKRFFKSIGDIFERYFRRRKIKRAIDGWADVLMMDIEHEDIGFSCIQITSKINRNRLKYISIKPGDFGWRLKAEFKRDK